MRGPFALVFNPDTALLAGAKQILESTKNAWLSFRDYDGRRLLYFTHILGNSCGVKEIRFGLDTMAPKRAFPAPACDKVNPGAMADNTTIHLETPVSTRFASVQITYYDGTKSTVERFDAQ
jgi:hypothetical protein